MSSRRYTNINISSNNNQFNYVVELLEGRGNSSYEIYKIEKEYVVNSGIYRSGNVWISDFKDKYSVKSVGIFEVPSSTIRVYFPQYSVETYSPGSLYMIDIYTYIGYRKLTLGSWKLKRSDSLASPQPLTYMNEKYYECIDLSIIDPMHLLYDDSCSLLRAIIKGNIDKNNDCSQLFISIHPIEVSNGDYLIKNGYEGGQNSIDISYKYNELKSTLSYSYGKFRFNIVYNDFYDNLSEYLEDTYNLKNISIKYLLTELEHNPDGLLVESSTNEFSIKGSDLHNNIFSSNALWKPGMLMLGKVIIMSNNTEKMILTTNKLPITPQLFSKIILSDESKLEINDNDDMNIQIINKLEQKITEYNIPDNSKSNIVIPTFYRVRDLAQVIIHPEVTENICINLDAYKSKVSSFLLKIEGITFKEIGTTPAGTIFKVVGNLLPRTNNVGTFYILDQDGQLVTTGKYIYEL